MSGYLWTNPGNVKEAEAVKSAFFLDSEVGPDGAPASTVSIPS